MLILALYPNLFNVSYVLKDGVVKVSIVLCDGREFNITYLKGLDMISLLKDEINKMTTASFHARIESDTATFYRINRKLFEQYVKENEELQVYIDSYYRKKMTEAIYRQQLMTMNGKNGAVCAFIYHLIPLFGRQVKKGVFIDRKSRTMILPISVGYPQETVSIVSCVG